jgi:hypothetical protein
VPSAFRRCTCATRWMSRCRIVCVVCLAFEVNMKARDTATRAKRFELNDRLRKLEDLEMMQRDFDTTIFELDRQITVEEERTGIKDALRLLDARPVSHCAPRQARPIHRGPDGPDRCGPCSRRCPSGRSPAARGRGPQRIDHRRSLACQAGTRRCSQLT